MKDFDPLVIIENIFIATQLVFIALKLIAVISWSWLYVLSPILLSLLIIIFVYTYTKIKHGKVKRTIR